MRFYPSIRCVNVSLLKKQQLVFRLLTELNWAVPQEEVRNKRGKDAATACEEGYHRESKEASKLDWPHESAFNS